MNEAIRKAIIGDNYGAVLEIELATVFLLLYALH